jgi:multiple antibiotic resistance protein
VLPIFIALTTDMEPSYRRAMAYKGVSIGAGVLILFALIGDSLLAMLGISLAAFRIAGGIMLLLMALEMVFERRSERRSKSAEDFKTTVHPDDISVFPLAIPLLAGPGAITAVLLLSGRYDGDVIAQFTVFGVMIAVLLICLILFLLSERLKKILGQTLTSIISRLLGILLAALAVQFIVDGIRNALLSE